ncbi:hypothetical protein B0T14DRAFT_278758 [Immersiella caudata]|uniref:DUF676 domain-containing protein n=1 Tax=Immersiella caudata TaxID=314043 RepID=A0AA39WDJ6_9PEZI|nr:hypothetical protein B0T14DRAFT_278758 [Immersiella caudata]
MDKVPIQEGTWTCKRESTRQGANDFEPPPKVLKLNPFSRALTLASHGGLESHVYWPHDLLPLALPHARVLIFGYDSRVRHRLASDIDKSTVCNFAWDLLLALEGCRRKDSSRSLLFAAHSLGGIVVKEMLRGSKLCQQGQAYLRCVFNATAEVMFFGTPNAGADSRATLHHVIEKVIKAAQFTVEEQIIQTLLPTSEHLKELRGMFGLMAQERNWTIHSFQEQLGVGALNDRKEGR